MDIVIGAPQPGDGGWVVAVHATHYFAAPGWGTVFEAAVAGIVSRHLAASTSDGEAFWIARVPDGPPLGSIICAREDPATARLRVFYVDPAARGQGLGARLIATCLEFAGGRGYGRIVLTTASGQASARRLYSRAGFRRTGAGRADFHGTIIDEETRERAL